MTCGRAHLAAHRNCQLATKDGAYSRRHLSHLHLVRGHHGTPAAKAARGLSHQRPRPRPPHRQICIREIDPLLQRLGQLPLAHAPHRIAQHTRLAGVRIGVRGPAAKRSAAQRRCEPPHRTIGHRDVSVERAPRVEGRAPARRAPRAHACPDECDTREPRGVVRMPSADGACELAQAIGRLSDEGEHALTVREGAPPDPRAHGGAEQPLALVLDAEAQQAERACDRPPPLEEHVPALHRRDEMLAGATKDVPLRDDIEAALETRGTQRAPRTIHPQPQAPHEPLLAARGHGGLHA